jgi:hypothetical protein
VNFHSFVIALMAGIMVIGRHLDRDAGAGKSEVGPALLARLASTSIRRLRRVGPSDPGHDKAHRRMVAQENHQRPRKTVWQGIRGRLSSSDHASDEKTPPKERGVGRDARGLDVHPAGALLSRSFMKRQGHTKLVLRLRKGPLTCPIPATGEAEDRCPLPNLPCLTCRSRPSHRD